MRSFLQRHPLALVGLLLTAIVGIIVFGVVIGTVEAQSAGIVRYRDPVTGHWYEVWPSRNMTRDQAHAFAYSKGGYPVVFNTMRELRGLIQGMGLKNVMFCHTGHQQDYRGWEPGGRWFTVTNEPIPPLNQLFNSGGPDDGITGGWNQDDDGTWYFGPQGKDEDAGVIWTDSLLEDVSIRHRGGVVIEFNG